MTFTLTKECHWFALQTHQYFFFKKKETEKNRVSGQTCTLRCIRWKICPRTSWKSTSRVYTWQYSSFWADSLLIRTSKVWLAALRLLWVYKWVMIVLTRDVLLDQHGWCPCSWTEDNVDVLGDASANVGSNHNVVWGLSVHVLLVKCWGERGNLDVSNATVDVLFVLFMLDKKCFHLVKLKTNVYP